MHRILVLSALLFSPCLAVAEEKPRLIVMLVFDQMRGDFLSRWEELYVEGGFKRLTSEGAWFTDCHYPYSYTMTGPGHATLVTGCPPMVHGIIGNDWYERKEAKGVGCVSSDRHAQIPAPPLPKGKTKVDLKGVAPSRLLAPTFADALKEQLGSDCRVVAFSLKDRGAVLPGGLQADACYWADKSGQFVTSNYYRDGLHAWVKAFNESKYVDRWHGKEWLRLRPDLDYVKYSGPDEVKGEGKGSNQGYTFPHPLNDGPKNERSNYYAAVACSPFGNDLLLELAKRAIEAEKLGSDDKPDFLSISFSSNDLVGHAWGPDSQEVLDITLRSDLLVRDLLNYLDEKVGKGKYVVTLSADHGICPLPEVSRSKGIDAVRIEPSKFLKSAEEYLNKTFHVIEANANETEDEKSKDPDDFKGNWIIANKSYTIYLNRKYLASRELSVEKVSRVLADWIAKQPGIAAAYTQADLLREELSDEIARMTRLSFHPERSGDVMVVVQKHCLFTGYLTGTSHGSPWIYDTHIPLVAMGPGIKPGLRKERVSAEHMAVILSRAAGIQPPAKARVKLPEGLFRE